MTRLTLEMLVSIMPNAEKPLSWVSPLNATMEAYDITTPRRMAAFLAQIAHETTELSRIVENMNYSALGLKTAFKRHFYASELELFARQPSKIANRVYAHRNGNGNEASNDGWRYRGRGLLPIIGRSNYRACGEALGLDLIERPDLLVEPPNAARAAGWYWESRKINPYADKEDIIAVTRLISGGVRGLDHRKAWYARAKNVLSG